MNLLFVQFRFGLEFLRLIKDQEQVLKDLQPVRKEQQQVLILVMKTVHVAMGTVHKVRTPKGLCSTQISAFWPMMSIGQWHRRDKHAAAAGSFLLRDLRKCRTTGCMQLDHDAVCTAVIVPQWSDRRLRQYKSWSPRKSWRSNERHVGTLYGYLRKSSRNKSQNEISCMKGSICSRCTKILQKVCWSKTFGVQILGWQGGSWSHRHEEG